MNYTNIIECKLKELEGGKFQRLCNDLLNRLGYGIVTNSGGMDGTDKTIKGTPDAYIHLKNGKFVFIEYTVQHTRIYDKFYKDIEKCLDENKTKVSVKNIEKIIIMYNSCLSVGEVQTLSDECTKNGIEFEKYDINSMVYLISSKFPFLSSDHLGIAIDSGQFLDYRTFIERNDKSILSTPLNLEIIGREDEINEILDKMKNFNCIIVSGKTGIGKTKLVLEAIQRYSNTQREESTWFVKDRGQGLYEELLRYTASGKHVIFVDDINKQTSLNELLDYFSENGDRIKIIATIRDYALNTSINTIAKFAIPEVYQVKVLKDEFIVELLEKNFEIYNQAYHKKILRLAKGNIRLAVMMATIAVKENRLDSVSNVGKLLEQYYHFMSEKLEAYNDVKILKALAALTFIDKLHLESEESMRLIESITGINTSELKDMYNNLFVDEMVDIYEGEIVVLSDQIVAIFIFHYAFEIKGILDYEVIIDRLFPEQKNRIIQNINGVIAYYDNIEFFENSIKELMVLWKQKDDIRYRELLLTFWFVKQEDTLLLIDEQINLFAYNNVLTDDYFYDRNVKYIEYDQLLNTLGQFSYSENNKVALELAFKYLKHDYSKIKEVSKMLIEHFGYDTESHRQGYQIQLILIDSIIARIDDNKDNEIIVQLFCNVSNYLMQFMNEYIENPNGKSIIIHQIPALNVGKMIQIRETIWKTCIKLIQIEDYYSYVMKFLEKYSEARIDTQELGLCELDFDLIQNELLPLLDISKINVCAVIYNIEKNYSRIIEKKFTFSNFSKLEAYDVFALLNLDCFDVSDDWEKGREILKVMYIDFAENMSESQYFDIIGNCVEIDKIGKNKYSYSNKMEIIILNARNFNMFLNAYLYGDTPFNVQPFYIIKKMIDQWGFLKTKEYIESKDFGQREYWMYILFTCADIEDIDNQLCREVLKYFNDTEHLCVGYYRNLDFLKNWVDIDKRIILKVIKKLFHKNDVFLKKIYFFHLFKDVDSVDDLIIHLSEDKDFLKELFLYSFKNNEIHDPDGIVCRKIIDIIPSVLGELLGMIFDDNVNDKVTFDFSIIWELDDEIIDDLFNFIMNLSRKFYIESKFDLLLFDSNTKGFEEKKKRTLTHYIRNNCNEEEKMRTLFYSLAKYDNETRIYYYNEFVKNNYDIESFKALPFDKSCDSWSGSEIPRIVKKQEFINELITSFDSINLLKHKCYLKGRLEAYEYYKKRIRISELLNDY